MQMKTVLRLVLHLVPCILTVAKSLTKKDGHYFTGSSKSFGYTVSTETECSNLHNHAAQLESDVSMLRASLDKDEDQRRQFRGDESVLENRLAELTMIEQESSDAIKNEKKIIAAAKNDVINATVTVERKQSNVKNEEAQILNESKIRASEAKDFQNMESSLSELQSKQTEQLLQERMRKNDMESYEKSQALSLSTVAQKTKKARMIYESLKEVDQELERTAKMQRDDKSELLKADGILRSARNLANELSERRRILTSQVAEERVKYHQATRQARNARESEQTSINQVEVLMRDTLRVAKNELAHVLQEQNVMRLAEQKKKKNLSMLQKALALLTWSRRPNNSTSDDVESNTESVAVKELTESSEAVLKRAKTLLLSTDSSSSFLSQKVTQTVDNFTEFLLHPTVDAVSRLNPEMIHRLRGEVEVGLFTGNTSLSKTQEQLHSSDEKLLKAINNARAALDEYHLVDNKTRNFEKNEEKWVREKIVLAKLIKKNQAELDSLSEKIETASIAADESQGVYLKAEEEKKNADLALQTAGGNRTHIAAEYEAAIESQRSSNVTYTQQQLFLKSKRNELQALQKSNEYLVQELKEKTKEMQIKKARVQGAEVRVELENEKLAEKKEDTKLNEQILKKGTIWLQTCLVRLKSLSEKVSSSRKQSRETKLELLRVQKSLQHINEMIFKQQNMASLIVQEQTKLQRKLREYHCSSEGIIF